jgi:hypothetical protein
MSASQAFSIVKSMAILSFQLGSKIPFVFRKEVHYPRPLVVIMMWLLPQICIVTLYLIPYVWYFKRDNIQDLGFDQENSDS